jgi:hypothetical protein
MFLPITSFYEYEYEDMLEGLPCCGDTTECNCCKVDPNTNKRGACICTDCKCHLRTRNNILTDPTFLYGVIGIAILTISYLVQK